VCTNASDQCCDCVGRTRFRNAQADRLNTVPRREFTPEKGRPPPGGEEARVVVHQPRGVGLIHPRHKAE